MGRKFVALESTFFNLSVSIAAEAAHARELHSTREIERKMLARPRVQYK